MAMCIAAAAAASAQQATGVAAQHTAVAAGDAAVAGSPADAVSSPAATVRPGPEPRGIFRVWTPRGFPAEVDVADLPLTATARATAAAYEPLDDASARDTTARDAPTRDAPTRDAPTRDAPTRDAPTRDAPGRACEPPGMPAMLDTPLPIEFVDEGDRVRMRFAAWDRSRLIHLAPGSAAAQPHSPQGVSFGRWEGEALAIFTTYIDYPYFDARGTPQSEAVTVLERYTPSPDFTRLDWAVTVTDPATFTRPVVRRGHHLHEPDQRLAPPACP